MPAEPDIDWSNDRRVAIRSFGSVAVYVEGGALFIHQEGQHGPSEDQHIAVDPRDAKRLIDAIKAAVVAGKKTAAQ
jgi:hypothetical protein